MKELEVFKWKCQECGKVVESLHKKQFEYNKEQHILKHKRNKNGN